MRKSIIKTGGAAIVPTNIDNTARRADTEAVGEGFAALRLAIHERRNTVLAELRLLNATLGYGANDTRPAESS